MDSALRQRLRILDHGFRDHLDRELLPFWIERAWDRTHGGFLTNFDEQGRDRGTAEKYLYSQCRQLWFFSHLHRMRPDARAADLARRGVDYLADRFWDRAHGGWFWKLRGDNSLLDDSKVVYGESFAIYALAEYALATGDAQARQLAIQTFDLLQEHAADHAHGGCFEFLEADWSRGREWRDRKSLDGHLHLMEAFTTLFQVSRADAHRNALIALTDLIAGKLVDPATGCGLNQVDAEFRPLPAITIPKMWNAAERKATPPSPEDGTSYGHNAELAWLLRRALVVAGAGSGAPTIRRLLDHTLEHGMDWEFGGVFRYGRAAGRAVDENKDFWPQAEALVGFLDGFEVFGETRHLDAVENIWNFVRAHMIAEAGEWRSLLERRGAPLDTNLGQPWKDAYHTGRAMIECASRLERMLGWESSRSP